MYRPHVMPVVETAERAGSVQSEDLVLTLPHAVVVLDGATSVELGRGSGGWYASVLGGELMRQISSPDASPDLRQVLAASIANVAATHSLLPGRSPSAALAIMRWTADVVEGLVLCDVILAVQTLDGAAEVLQDSRLDQLDHPERAAYLEAIRAGTPFDQERLRVMQAFTRERRNQPDGYWVAEADPKAAHEAIRMVWPRHTIKAALMATDGVACGVHPYQVLPDWTAMFEMVKHKGVGAVVDLVHRTEHDDPDARRWPRFKAHDDKALACIHFLEEQ